MVNVNKLKAKMVELGMNVEELSSQVGIDRATFYRRLASNGEDFYVKEADGFQQGRLFDFPDRE